MSQLLNNLREMVNPVEIPSPALLQGMELPIPTMAVLPQSAREEAEWFLRISTYLHAEGNTITTEEVLEILGLLPRILPTLRRKPAMTFEEALTALRAGHRVAAADWEGKFLVYVPGSDITVEQGRPLAAVFQPGTKVHYEPHIDMVSVEENYVVVWNPTQADFLRNDWKVL